MLIKISLCEILAQVFSCEFCEIFKNNFFYKTPPLAKHCNTGYMGAFVITVNVVTWKQRNTCRTRISRGESKRTLEHNSVEVTITLNYASMITRELFNLSPIGVRKCTLLK